MEEKNNTENEKKKKTKNSDEKKFDLTEFINIHKNEFKKIVWPSKDELLKQTGTVIVVSLVVGLIIFAYDSVISYTYEKAMNMVKAPSSENSIEVSPSGDDTESSTSDSADGTGSAADSSGLEVGNDGVIDLGGGVNASEGDNAAEGAASDEGSDNNENSEGESENK